MMREGVIIVLGIFLLVTGGLIKTTYGEEKQTTSSGLVIPDTAKEKPIQKPVKTKTVQQMDSPDDGGLSTFELLLKATVSDSSNSLEENADTNIVHEFYDAKTLMDDGGSGPDGDGDSDETNEYEVNSAYQLAAPVGTIEKEEEVQYPVFQTAEELSLVQEKTCRITSFEEGSSFIRTILMKKITYLEEEEGLRKCRAWYGNDPDNISYEESVFRNKSIIYAVCEYEQENPDDRKIMKGEWGTDGSYIQLFKSECPED